MMDIEKLKMESKDILNENIKKVADLFPNCLVESEEGKKIDFDLLRQELSGDIVDGPRERYHLDFPGKREAIVESNRKITKTLRPIKDKSVNFDTTKNIYIEGDNLEALKILQESYLGKIKCIYIDPPYNTGNDFVYNDDFSHSEKEELERQGRIDENGNVLTSNGINNESNGRYHSDWLKMMYPRLKLARNLLSDDGVIFISIDDNEVDNLRKLCDEVFGENNILSLFVWEKTQHMGRQKINKYSNIEYLICYSKRIMGNEGLKELLVEKISNELDDAPLYNDSNPEKELSFPKGSVKFNIKDGIYDKSDDEKYKLIEKVIVKDGYNDNVLKLKFRSRWSAQTVLDEYNKGCKYWVKTKNFAIRTIYQADKTTKISPKQMIFTNRNNEMCSYNRFGLKVGTNEEGTSELNKLFDLETFSYPKPMSLISYLVSLLFDYKNEKFENDLVVLDFFSGSATTAHAVMKLNAEDGGNRQFIMVQLPEATDENSEAYKAGFKNICDIGEERIRRAGKKILEESKNNVGAKLANPLDIGFRVYKIDDSNMKDIYYKPDEIDQKSVLDYISNVKEDRTALDLLTQVMLNLGLTLDLKIEEKKIDKNLFYFVEDNALVACFDEKIDLDSLSKALECKPLKIVCKESSFEKDQDKINFNERIKKHSPETEKYII